MSLCLPARAATNSLQLLLFFIKSVYSHFLGSERSGFTCFNSTLIVFSILDQKFKIRTHVEISSDNLTGGLESSELKRRANPAINELRMD